MKLLKQILKIIAGLAIGSAIGFTIVTLCVLLFSDTTFPEYLDAFSNIKISEGVASVIVAIASFFISLFLLVIIHETGHLICGLLTGYRFVSFRIFNITFIKVNGKLRVKQFAIAGTGGQCLLSPPDLPLKKIPALWYNAGGVIANIIILAVITPLLWMDLNPFLSEFIGIMALTDLGMILLNGIPMQANGIGNDASNILQLRHDMAAKKGMVIQLRSNALIQEGTRPKDMPAEWFEVPPQINYASALEVAIPLMHASRMLDMGDYEKAFIELDSLYAHKDTIMPLYVKEIACELAFTALATGRTDYARRLLDNNLLKYIEASRKSMSSKERLVFAIALYLENNPEKAKNIYNALLSRQSAYLLQGEVASDLAIMQNLMHSL